MLADIVFGRRYLWPHDYVSLRRRYSHHRGAYGWCRKWRLRGFVLLLGRHRYLGWTMKVYPTPKDHEPYWREETNQRIAGGWA